MLRRPRFVKPAPGRLPLEVIPLLAPRVSRIRNSPAMGLWAHGAWAQDGAVSVGLSVAIGCDY